MMSIFPLHPLQVQQASEKHYFHLINPFQVFNHMYLKVPMSYCCNIKKIMVVFTIGICIGPTLKFRLLQTSAEELREIYEVEEGLENRLHSLAIKCESFTQFMNELKTKRYTRTRLQRILTHILTHTKKKEMAVNGGKGVLFAFAWDD